jgi:hypothetical protein
MNDESERLTGALPGETDLEALADRIQSKFALEKAERILGMMRSIGTTSEAVALFEAHWPHINKAWARACASAKEEVNALSIDFLRITTPMLLVVGEREVLRERVDAALQAARRTQDQSLLAITGYFAAIAAIQYRDYAAALPLLEFSRDNLPKDNGDPTPIDVLTALGSTYLGLGDEQRAGTAFEDVSKLVFLRNFSFPFTAANMERLQNDSLNRLFSGAGLVALLAKPPKSLGSSAVPQGGAAFFRPSGDSNS